MSLHLFIIINNILEFIIYIYLTNVYPFLAYTFHGFIEASCLQGVNDKAGVSRWNEMSGYLYWWLVRGNYAHDMIIVLY
jgi:hypothetical protein